MGTNHFQCTYFIRIGTEESWPVHVARDPFLGGFIQACDAGGALRSAWELDLGGFCR